MFPGSTQHLAQNRDSVMCIYWMKKRRHKPYALFLGDINWWIRFYNNTEFNQPGSALSEFIRNLNQPWLVWLSGLSIGLWIEGSPVQFLVRAHAWVVGQVTSWGCARGNQWMYLSHISLTCFSLSLSLSPTSSLKINKLNLSKKKEESWWQRILISYVQRWPDQAAVAVRMHLAGPWL